MAVKSSKSKLYRSETNKVLAGVCGGLGEYLGIDPVILRVIFAILTVFGGGGIILYLLLWIFIPNKSSSKDYINDNVEELKEKTRDITKNGNGRFFLGLIIIFAGLSILAENLGFYMFREIWKFWPVILIILGISLLTDKH